MRLAEGRIAEEEETKNRALASAKKVVETAENKVTKNQVMISSLEMQLKAEEELRVNLQNEVYSLSFILKICLVQQIC